jgi:hypothetical protein
MAVRFLLLEDLLNFLSLFDNPGTYIMMIVLGMAILPFYLKSINRQLRNPEESYMVSFGGKFFTGLLFVAFLIFWGLYNFFRFVR